MMDHKIELLTKTIEDQNVTISNYKTKLKDVVLAYKNLSQEKSALEATIAALKNIRPTSSQSANKCEESENTEKQDSSSEHSHIAPEDEAASNDKGQPSGTKATESQIDVLVSSLLTVTRQKDRLESNCVAERKQFRAELAEKNNEIENLNQKITELESENNEWRIKLRTQQQEHDKQQNDCALMIKELQSLLNSERIIKEQLQSQLEELKAELDEKKKATSAHVAVLTSNESSLREELQWTNVQLKEALNKLSQPVPKLALLEMQLKEAKEAEARLRNIESKKLMEAEMNIAEISKITEARICTLEEKILQLSEMLGNAEKGKLHDQCTIQKLKEKNGQLDLENKTLISLMEKNSSIDEMSPQEIISKFKEVIPSLISSGHDLSPLHEELNCGHDLHKTCRAQLEQVQEEFGRYKLRAQSVLKNKSKDPSNESEANQMKKQFSELKERINHLKNDGHAKELELHNKDESHAKIVSCLKEKHKSELSQTILDWQQKVLGLESELRKQRERTVNMLAEKEQEITELKFYYSPTIGHKSESDRPSPNTEMIFPPGTIFNTSSLLPDDNGIGASSMSIESEDESSKRDTNNSLKHLLSRRNEAVVLGKEASNLLHFAQEKARLEMEIALMRKQKNAAEAAAREVQYLLMLKDDEHNQEVKAFKESLSKVERDIGRESANLEYLKNVVYHYMICRDASSRQQMFNAISTILQFSPQEKQTVQSKKSWKL